ncbi:phosphatase PAP2 family protein [Mycobacterium sp. PS03-16]|uniref:phosphatase PAP2 family protein n=1 Tax=Mycobacterium sp. PS03-16 TaxID=2559611 RepID=UPI001073F290|nr:phosphatase PAP2 family protein [Mycobacterium sp. PS03-16]TFV55438.1 phosphatase PAP2 family protein [Mycobacterium sp. PS03-16]
MTRRTWLIASAVAAVAVFALLWIGIARHWAWLATADLAVLEPFDRLGLANPAWVTGWDVYCTVLGPTVFRLVGVAVIVVMLLRRHFRTALFLALTVECSGLLTQVVKNLADRPRPATALVGAHSTSFPSGHAVGVMICVLAFLTVLLPLLRPSARGWAIAVGALVVVTIGIGRVVLNVHHPSDVVAGWALGYAWFVGCLLVAAPARAVSPAAGTPAALDSAR